MGEGTSLVCRKAGEGSNPDKFAEHILLVEVWKNENCCGNTSRRQGKVYFPILQDAAVVWETK